MAQHGKQAGDLRVRRTRKLLMEALISLIVEKGFSAISVQNIADRAMVNRATFYRHYRDKYDLLGQYMNEVYELTAFSEEPPSPQTRGENPLNPPEGMVRMFEHVQRHADFYRAMLGTKGDPAFVRGIHQYSEKRLREVYGPKLKGKNPPPDFCLSYLSYAGIGVLAWWLERGRSYTPRQIVAWTVQLNNGTVSEVGSLKA